MSSVLLTNASNSVKSSHLVGIALLLGFVLPHTNTFFLLINPLLCIYLSWHYKDRKWNRYVLWVLVPLSISMVLNFQVAALKAFQSTFTIMLLFACFPYVGKTKVSNKYIYLCFGYILISQLVYVLDITFLTNFFNNTYPIAEDDIARLERVDVNITYITLLDYRLGGLYHNSNQCARYVTFLLAFYLLNGQREKSKLSLVFILLAYFSIILTGSRTGFAIASLVIFFGYIRNHKTSALLRFFLICLALYGVYYIIQSGISFRGAEIEAGVSNSLSAKFFTFLYYILNETSGMKLLFGNLDISLFEGSYGIAMSHFDCEYGSLIYKYGFIGFGGIIYFWWLTWKRMDKTTWIYFILLLWIISSTIIASYRASFVFMLLLSVLYNQYRIIETSDDNNKLHR